MKNTIVGAIQAAFNAAMSRPNNALRYKMTDARIDTLRKIHGADAAFLNIVHNFYGATNYRSQNKYLAQIRAYVPEAIAAIWAKRDAKQAEPLLRINERVAIRFNPRNPRTPFNAIRVI